MKTFKTPKGTELPLTPLKGKDYLMVAYRLVWFREERPTWTIKTEKIESSPTSCLFRAEIYDGSTLISTGHKREDKGHFGDFEEKAETGAIGRALACCGYGTQFAPEMHEEDRIVDSPVSPKASKPLKPVSDANAKSLASLVRSTKAVPASGEFVIKIDNVKFKDVNGKKIKEFSELKLKEMLHWAQTTKVYPTFQVATSEYIKFLDLEKKLQKQKTESYGEPPGFEDFDGASQD